MKPILITGPTGNIGKHVSDILGHRDLPLRLGMRSITKTDSLDSSPQVHLDFSKPSTYEKALHGCKAVFLLRPPAIANTKQTLNVFIDQAYRLGVEHIVFVSVAGAQNNRFVPHYAVEQKLINSGESYTILRPGFFAQNLGDAYRQDIQEDNRIFLPSGQGLVNFIDAQDISEIAANILTNPSLHKKRAYTLAGQEALSFTDVAKMLSDSLERPIRYEASSILAYARHLHKRKLPLMQVVVQSILHTGIRTGGANIQDGTAQTLLNRPTRSIETYIQEYKSLWE